MTDTGQPDSPWRKPRRSFSNGNCVMIAAWRKPRRSANNGACVEVGTGTAVVGVRDSKLPGTSPVLLFRAGAWARFTRQVKAGA
jgi:uncharacterized protein DUF397